MKSLGQTRYNSVIFTLPDGLSAHTPTVHVLWMHAVQFTYYMGAWSLMIWWPHITFRSYVTLNQEQRAGRAKFLAWVTVLLLAERTRNCKWQQQSVSTLVFTTCFAWQELSLTSKFSDWLTQYLPIPVAGWSKARVSGRSLPGFAISDLAGGIDVCLLQVLCVVRYRSLRRADPPSRWVLPTVVCLTECD